ncbi:MAG TPA: PDZ domain-containing protein [Terriglobales bacterium]|nr:PDZ domain-containing protein [Terriglobales bacterium]
MKRVLLALLCASFALPCAADSSKPYLFRKPAISQTQIAFSYAGDLWIAPREGGDARRLTTGAGMETTPMFSPDGSQIAFTGDYDGNRDVYVIPAAGGVPKRLTFHPGPDEVLGWTPDGKRILFRSNRDSHVSFVSQFYTVPSDGGFPEKLPLPMGEEGSFSPDGTHLAYVPNPKWQQAWKRYHGGQTTPIWIVNLADSSVEAKIPRDNSNDSNPMWVGDTIYFLSDRNGPISLFAYDTKSKQVTEVASNHGLDFKYASAGPGAIIVEQFGAVHVFDTTARQLNDVSIRVAGDLPELRPHFAKVDPKTIHNIGLSPTGVRAVVEARGEILTIPSDKGDVRNLTNTTGIVERDPAWSPNGKWIAYFSDAGGEYGLELRLQNGMGEPKRINLGQSFYYSPQWSPDSRKIVYTDKRLNLWYVDINDGKPVKVDANLFEAPEHSMDPQWSPDSRWITYTRFLPNHLHAVFVYSVASGKSVQVTDGLSDARYPSFDAGGKYLYFTASTDLGLGSAWLDMSSLARPVTRAAYIVTLTKDQPSPLAPESDEEKVAEEKKEEKTPPGKPFAQDKAPSKQKAADKEKDKAESQGDEKSDEAKKAPVEVKIDFENIGQRVLALPIPPRNYVAMSARKTGILFLAEAPRVTFDADQENPSLIVHKFDLKKRKADKFLEDIAQFITSENGDKILYRKADQWIIASTDEPPKPDAPPKPGEGPLKMSDLQVYVEPMVAWKQMYREVWRIERDFFYDPHHHGLDLKAAEAKYAPYLDNLGDRQDLNYLFEEMLGELTVGHMFVGGGDDPVTKPPAKTGLLGADYVIENGRYRFSRVIQGENWNPDLKAPLTEPGVNVRQGEYLLAVNGRDLRGSDNLYSFFLGTAGKSVVLKVGPNADGSGAREVTVVPIDSEVDLRNLAWIEANRRKVDEMTGGKVAYVYVPNTAEAGYSRFNRYFFAQLDKQAAIIDERFNTGGDIADYIVDHLRRPVMSMMMTRDGREQSSPMASIYGPKVMLINQLSGSGGDALPWYFRKAAIGPLIGKRTWGGLVGIYDYPELMDGGQVTAPRIAIYGLKGEWEVENHGIPPDIEVELDPKAVREGHDPQLEMGIKQVMDLLEKNPLQTYPRPAYPNYHQGASAAAGSSQ